MQNIWWEFYKEKDNSKNKLELIGVPDIII